MPKEKNRGDNVASPRSRKAIMIVIGVGKKKKVQKKMGGGMTAGSQSAMGRLQKANMMSKGGLKTELNKPAGTQLGTIRLPFFFMPA